MSNKILSLLFIGLCLNSAQVRADVADTLSVEVSESDWTGGLDISIQGDTTNLSQILSTTLNIKKVNVYNLAGRIVLKNVMPADALKELPKGIYIINRRKYVVR